MTDSEIVEACGRLSGRDGKVYETSPDDFLHSFDAVMPLWRTLWAKCGAAAFFRASSTDASEIGLTSSPREMATAIAEAFVAWESGNRRKRNMNAKLVPGKTTFLYVNDEPIGTCGVNADGTIQFPAGFVPQDGMRIVWLQPDEWNWDEFEMHWNPDDEPHCDLCGDEGVREYNDAPDEWGEDCPSEVNHLIPCRGCDEVRRERIVAFSRWLWKRRKELNPPEV